MIAEVAAAPLSMLQSCQGLRFEPTSHTVALERPVLPAFLHEVWIRRLPVVAHRTDLKLRRAHHQVLVSVTGRSSSVRVDTVS